MRVTSGSTADPVDQKYAYERHSKSERDEKCYPKMLHHCRHVEAWARKSTQPPAVFDFPLASPFKFHPHIRLASNLLPLGPGQCVSRLK